MVLAELAFVNPIYEPVQHQAEFTSGEAAANFWKLVDIDSHNLRVGYLALYAITHKYVDFTADEAVALVRASLSHDEGKKMAKISPVDYFAPKLSREQVFQIFGDHGPNSVKMQQQREPAADLRELTLKYWHHCYGVDYAPELEGQLLDLRDDKNHRLRRMLAAQIVFDRSIAGAELRHGKKESRPRTELMDLLKDELAAYPAEFKLSFEGINVDAVVDEAYRSNQPPYAWSPMATTLNAFQENQGEIGKLMTEMRRMHELVIFTYPNYIKAMADFLRL